MVARVQISKNRNSFISNPSHKILLFGAGKEGWLLLGVERHKTGKSQVGLVYLAGPKRTLFFTNEMLQHPQSRLNQSNYKFVFKFYIKILDVSEN